MSDSTIKKDKIIPHSITTEMRAAYLDYAMTVITARALPDIRDGLKPVHRRILYAMHKMGLTANAKTKKSATVVGEVLGKYHPHGDSAVYDALVNMAQDFSMRYPLIIGQGNFGSIDGDAAAAMRYCVVGDTFVVTDKGLQKIKDISKDKKEKVAGKVLSMHGKVNKFDKWFDSGTHPTIKITTKRGYSLKGSYNHPVLVWSKDKITGEPNFSWKLLEKVQKGDIVVLDRTQDTLWPEKELDLKEFVPKPANKKVQIKTLPTKLNKDLAFLLGLIVSEANVRANKIEFANADKVLIDEFERIWKKLFPDTRLHKFSKKPSSYGKKPYWRLEIHSLYVIEFLKKLGVEPVLSAKKTIPEAVLMSPKEVLASFLQGYFEGDGTITYSSKMIELSAISKSKKLLEQLQVVLLRFGIDTTLYYDKHRTIYKLYIRGRSNYELFQAQINFFSQRKKTKLANAIKRVSSYQSLVDYIPFISEYARGHVKEEIPKSSFIMKNNFDRYHSLQKNSQMILQQVQPKAKEVLEYIFNLLQAQKYLFDVVEEVKNCKPERVYSVRVASKCHSFVGNGFVNHNTEAKMSGLAGEMLKDIEKNTVDFRPNYDNTHKEPVVLPSLPPNLLLNGSLGIAVGMATNIPPHNLTEVIGAEIHLIDNPKSGTQELLEFVKGPDFPTGCIAFNKKDILEAYKTGKGSVVVRGEAEIVEAKHGSYQIIISSIPYRVNKANLIAKIAELVQSKKIEGIKGLRDESTKEIRIVIDLKKDAHPQAVLNQIYKHTVLEDSFHYNMVALIDGVPQTVGLKTILQEHIKHRLEVITRRAQFDLEKAKAREHILIGLKKALDHIDEIIKLIKQSKDVPTAHAGLMKKFKFSEIQATAILEMKLQKLANLERKKIEDELKEVQKLIKELEALLKSDARKKTLIKKELQELKEKYGDDRRTKIVARPAKDFSMEDLVPDEDFVLTLTKGGYIKRTSPSEYRKQKRGGIGISDIATKEEDVVSTLIVASAHSDILFFSDAGRVYKMKMYEIAEAKRATKGKPIVNYLPLSGEERITSVLAMPKQIKDNDQLHLFMVTRAGVVKKTDATQFYEVRRNGLIAIKLADGDRLKSAFFTQSQDTVMIVTKNGMSIRFAESDVRAMGRAAAGVKGISLSKDDFVVGASVVDNQQQKDLYLLVVSSTGYGKRTKTSEYKVQKRGGSGIKTMNINEKTKEVVGAAVVRDEGELVLITQKGITIRLSLEEVPVLSRATVGVKVMKLKKDDKIASIEVVQSHNINQEDDKK